VIPVLAVPVLNRADLLAQMLTSIDEPVRRLYVIDNGAGLRRVRCREARSAHICSPGTNLGVARSWNLAIEANIAAPWWLIVNNDVFFEAGALARLVTVMDMADGPLSAALCGFGAFALNAAAVEAVGWFDPAFTPIYYEDSDWQRRALLKGVPIVNVYSDTVHVNGGENAAEAAPDANARTKYANRQRYEQKWGPHARAGTETFTTPFDSGSDPALVTLPSLSLLREQSW
jgi:GT2 family glycosyltransferase